MAGHTPVMQKIQPQAFSGTAGKKSPHLKQLQGRQYWPVSPSGPTLRQLHDPWWSWTAQRYIYWTQFLQAEWACSTPKLYPLWTTFISADEQFPCSCGEAGAHRHIQMLQSAAAHSRDERGASPASCAMLRPSHFTDVFKKPKNQAAADQLSSHSDGIVHYHSDVPKHQARVSNGKKNGHCWTGIRFPSAEDPARSPVRLIKTLAEPENYLHVSGTSSVVPRKPLPFIVIKNQNACKTFPWIEGWRSGAHVTQNHPYILTLSAGV